jgi:hypothetical protein
MTETLSLDTKPETKNVSPANILRIRNFRLLWIGEGISLLGDQFYLLRCPGLSFRRQGMRWRSARYWQRLEFRAPCSCSSAAR